jgi:uncharacterized iron-regulated protein
VKVFVLVFSLVAAVSSAAQFTLTPESYRVFTGRGEPSTLEAITGALATTDVLFLGELHDDAVGHAVQFEIFRQAVERYSRERRVALSLEMFERDVQIVLDEYLNGLITEQHLIAAGRAWPNYKTDYAPLVELAKKNRLPVIAANAPRRYVNMVSRNGRSSLNSLSKEARRWIAKLPYAEASPAYAQKFRSLMGSSNEARMGLDNILSSQSLWDATMAESIAIFAKKNDRSLVVHLNGAFHSEGRLGAVEHLLRYRPMARVLVINVRYEDQFDAFTPRHMGTGDFVVLTDAKVPRSRR